ncbi:MAG TPA: radical SAM protein [bacterium]|nr:radical SAM protein [bacterium]HPQ19999.1 radical SAM protein [bacterium]
MNKNKNREVISEYLKTLIKDIENKFGIDSPEVLSLKKQYYYSELEENILEKETNKHYEADAQIIFKNKKIFNIERLYRRTLVIEITSVCASRCRWCLRANYKPIIMNNEEFDLIAEYCGSQENKDDLKEVLITGGDPLMLPDKLHYLIEAIINKAPNIKIIRIGSRLIFQDPKRIDSKLLYILRPRENIKFEIGTQVNSYLEITKDAELALKKLLSNNITIYNQSVLLKGVNDNLDFLIELYDKLRYLNIESHYLFHCVPLKGMQHHRTSVDKGLRLIKQLTSRGLFSGRSKPMFTLMTDIGKITLYENTIQARKDHFILLKSEYLYSERCKWNKNWKLPRNAIVNADGTMSVWYLDGCDD